MACFSCRSENVKAFTSEISIHFPGKENLTKGVIAFPKLLACLDCGLTDVLLSEDELRKLQEMYSSCSQTSRIWNVILPPEPPTPGSMSEIAMFRQLANRRIELTGNPMFTPSIFHTIIPVWY